MMKRILIIFLAVFLVWPAMESELTIQPSEADY